jgi:ferredoxin-thioredoxin reductase catalytic subunit
LINIDKIKRRAESDARSNGCYLNSDSELLDALLEGLKRNQERYGYTSCPCRLASGSFVYDRDVICPCDYRDIDVREFGACYCGLYIRKDVVEEKTPLQFVPERRPIEKQARAYDQPEEKSRTGNSAPNGLGEMKQKLWFCKQCDYVCFREDPPYLCPICKAKRELFAPLVETSQ